MLWFASLSHLLYEFTVQGLHAFTTFSCLCYTHGAWIYKITVLLWFRALAHTFHDFYAFAMCLYWVFFSTFKHFPPLMLRRKIFTYLLTRLMLRSSFQLEASYHNCCYPLRSLLNFPDIMDATLSDLFQHYWCFASRSSLLFSIIFSEISQHHGCYSISSFLTSLMLCYASRYTLLFSIITDAELWDLMFNYLTSWFLPSKTSSSSFYHHWC